MPGPDIVFELVSQGVIDYMNSRQQIIDLNLAKPVDWFQGQPESASTSRPANPYLQCPRILLTGDQGQFEARSMTAGQIHNIKATISLFYYRRQQRGQNHQKIMKSHVDQICTPFTRDKLLPPNLSSGAVQGFLLEKCFPGIITYHSSLKHDFKDPNLTISVSEINFIIEGKIHPYA